MTMDRPSAELRELVEAASNGELTPGDCARLEAILEADPAARRFYVRRMSLDADLWREASTGGLTGGGISRSNGRSPGSIRASRLTAHRHPSGGANPRAGTRTLTRAVSESGED
jgi:hypothetical protein